MAYRRDKICNVRYFLSFSVFWWPSFVHSEAFNCSHTRQIEEALKTASFTARGVNKFVFGIELYSRPFVLKSGDFESWYEWLNCKCANLNDPPAVSSHSKPEASRRKGPIVSAYVKLSTYSSPGLPVVHGFCDSYDFTWLLLEKASPFRLPFPFHPTCEQLFHLVESPFLLFAKYPQLILGSDVNGNQFAVTPDWRVVLADLDIFDTKDHEEFYRGNATTCAVNADCMRPDAPIHKSRRRLYMYCGTSCIDSVCAYASTEQRITCVLGKSVIAPLAKHYPALTDAAATAADQPAQRLGPSKFLHFLAAEKKAKCENMKRKVDSKDIQEKS